MNMSKTLGLVSVRELAVMLNRPYRTVYEWQRTGVIPEPKQLIPSQRRRYYSPEDAAELVRLYGIEKDGE